VRQLKYGDSGSAIQIPLKISFTLDGIAKIIAGQVFKVSNNSFPIGYNFDNTELWSHFSVMNINHTIANGLWNTNIEAQLYLNFDGKRELSSQFTNFDSVRNEFESTMQSIRDNIGVYLNNATNSE
jgi:hypothetical protein